MHARLLRGLPLAHQLDKLWQTQAKATRAVTTTRDVHSGVVRGGNTGFLGGGWFLHIDGDLKGGAIHSLEYRRGILQRQL